MRAARASWWQETACRTSAKNLGLEAAGAILDQAQAEVDVAEEPALDRGQEEGPPVELAGAAGVVQERGREQESVRRRGWSWAASRQSDATPTVCSSRPPAQAWWLSWVAGSVRSRVRKSASPAKRATSPRRPGWAISAARNSKKPSSSSRSRRDSA